MRRTSHAVLIRDATADDAPEITVLLNALLATTPIEWTLRPRTLDDVLAWQRQHEVVLVADDDGVVVGVAAFGWFRDVVKWPGYRFTVENTVHVREGMWGRGVGNMLMRALIERAREAGKHAMIAAVDSTNDASIRFHDRLGFTKVAHLPQVGAKFGHWLDLVLLQLTLDARPAPDPE
jgi:phosphinothricin acetyltransferase